MNNNLFDSNDYKNIEQKVINYLNSLQDYLSLTTIESTRAVGDAIQKLVAAKFEEILGDVCVEYRNDFARRAMADLAFKDNKNNYYVVDVKTHRLGDTKFNMPNLTSVKRLADLYKNDSNYFVILFISYKVVDAQAFVEKCHFVPIEYLGWDCLTVGALGEGQIQIKNSNNITIRSGYSRKAWMIELCDYLLKFYSKEITKIQKRITNFEGIRSFWENHE